MPGGFKNGRTFVSIDKPEAGVSLYVNRNGEDLGKVTEWGKEIIVHLS